MTELPDAAFIADVVDVVWLSGADHLAFLERMSTNRLADLTPGTGRATAVLSDTGRVVDLVSCHAGAAGSALVTSGLGGAAAVAEHLRRYVLRDRVRITDASQQVLVLRLLGAGAAAAAGHATGLALAGRPAGGWIEGEWGGTTTWALRHAAPGGLDGADVVVPRGEPAAAMRARLGAAGVAELSPDAYAAQRVRRLWPAFGSEIDGQSNPLELGLRPVVDFDKGCYIGQEVVARLDTYDKVQRHLVRLRSERPLASGAALRLAEPATAGSPRTAGRITTAASLSGRAGRALAMAVPAVWAVGQRLATTEGGDPAEIDAAVAR